MTPLELLEARQRLGLTQAQLALALGVDALTVSRWERGVRTPQPYVGLALERLAQLHAMEA